MKTPKTASKIHVYAIMLFSLCISTGIMSMARISSRQTPEQRRMFATRQAALRKMQEQKKLAGQASAVLPSDIHTYHITPQIVAPVINYLKSEIIKKNVLNPNILEGHPAKITNAEFSENGKILVTSCKSDQDNLIIWNVEKAKKIQTISVPNLPNANVEIVVPSPDGSKVISASGIENNKLETYALEGTLILWNTATGKQIKILDLPQKYISEIEFSFDGKRIIVTGAPGKIITDANTNGPESQAYIYIADANTGNTIATHEIINNFPNITKNPNGNTMVVRSNEDLNLYDLNTGKLIAKLDGPTQKLYNLSYSADGRKIIASDTLTQTVFIWGGETGKQLKQFNDILAFNVALNSNATKMLTNSTDNSISIWDVATQTIIKTLNTQQQNQIYAVKFSPDNSMIALENNNIIVWNASTEEQLISASGNDFTFSSDSKRIQTHTSAAENEEKCTMVLWDVATKQQIHTFIAEHDLFEMTPDLLNAISPDDANNHNFVLWTPFTQEERIVLGKINALTIKQAQYIHQLYMAKLSRRPITFANNAEFNELSTEIQNIIIEYLGSK